MSSAKMRLPAMVVLAVLVLSLSGAPLTPGVAVHSAISSGETHTFSLEADAHLVVTGALDQGETDLAVAVLDPEGRTVARFDARERGDELVAFETTVRGVYRIDVTTVGAGVQRASYGLLVNAPRAATPTDSQLIAAATLATEARQLFKKGDRESLLQAVERRRRALALWEAADQRPAMLATLVGTGDALYRLTQYADADEPYKRALALSRALG